MSSQQPKKQAKHYHTWLLDEFSARKSKNSNYSIRAFARHLGLGASTLSGVLSRRRDLSKKNAIRVAQKLALSPGQTNALLEEIGFKPDEHSKSQEFFSINDDTFNMISNWYYFGIINLCKFGKNGARPQFFAKRLGISKLEVVNAIDRLKRLGFVEIVNGELRASTPMLSTTRNVPSSALRKYHKQNLEKAAHAIEHVPVNLRDISSISFPADLSKYKHVTDLIMEFKRKVARIFEEGSPSEVYTLAIQLFPISINTGDKK